MLAISIAQARVWADEPPPNPAPSRPLREAAARLVQKLEEDKKAPCRKVAKEVPCFPVSTEQSRPEWTVSVRDSIGDLGPAGKPSPNRPPTLDEMKAFRPGPAALLIPVVRFDPVCTGKSVLKRFRGKNDTYYLYRVRDIRGERVALYGHRLEAATFQGAVEFIGRFDGECEALAAYRHESNDQGS
jgi:hypothetical protein